MRVRIRFEAADDVERHDALKRSAADVSEATEPTTSFSAGGVIDPKSVNALEPYEEKLQCVLITVADCVEDEHR
jgi:hypothetical protein